MALTTFEGPVCSRQGYVDVNGNPVIGSTLGLLSGFNEGPANKSYTVFLNTPFAGTISSTTTVCLSGTCTATFKVNSTALGGAVNNVSSSEQSIAHNSDNTFNVGDNIVLTISDNSTCVDMAFSIQFNRT